MQWLIEVCCALTMIHAIVNPFIYYFMCPRYKRAFIYVMKKLASHFGYPKPPSLHTQGNQLKLFQSWSTLYCSTLLFLFPMTYFDLQLYLFLWYLQVIDNLIIYNAIITFIKATLDFKILVLFSFIILVLE